MESTGKSHDDEIPVGISACILGAKVRFNGGHKLDRFVRDTLGAYLRFVPVCPEVELGLDTPREILRLVRDAGEVRLIAPKSGTDHSESMREYARDRVEKLLQERLCGYILQKNSPSCGMERVKIYPPVQGPPIREGRGLFAEALISRFPDLPVEEEGRLNDPALRENFVERIFAYRRLQRFFSQPWSVGELVALHSREKFLVLSHHRATYDALGRLVANAKGRPPEEVEAEYRSLFMKGLKKITTRGNQANTLQHLVGHFKKVLDAEDRKELAELIARYQEGLLPLIVPITLLKHHIRRHQMGYLAQQSYLDPHPYELMLRNHG